MNLITQNFNRTNLMAALVTTIRTETKLSTVEVYTRLEMAQSTYARIEVGAVEITLDMFMNIFAVLGKDPQGMFSEYLNFENFITKNGGTVLKDCAPSKAKVAENFASPKETRDLCVIFRNMSKYTL